MTKLDNKNLFFCQLKQDINDKGKGFSRTLTKFGGYQKKKECGPLMIRFKCVCVSVCWENEWQYQQE